MSTRIRARRTPRLPASIVLMAALALGRTHSAFADAAPPGGSPPKPAATAAAAPVAPAADAIEVKEDGARWENGYGEKFFQVIGTVTNRSAAPVGAVRIRVELLDESGKVVATFDAWNARAEALGDLEGEAARAELGELAPGPIAPGESDRFRSTFLADETPPFSAHRARVITVLPPV